MAFGLFSLLAVGQPDTYLLTGATISVPSLGAASSKALLVVGPLLLVGLRLYLQVYLEHWQRLNAIAEKYRLPYAPRLSPLKHPLLSPLTWALLYFLVPAALVAFTWQAMAIPKWWGYGLFFVTAFVIAAHMVQQLAIPWCERLVICVVITASVGVAAYQGRHNELRRPFDLRFANLSLVDLAGRDLRDAQLGQANLQRTHLNGANFNNADLTGASLENTKLRWATFKGTNLSKVDFVNAKFWPPQHLPAVHHRRCSTKASDRAGKAVSEAQDRLG